MILECPHCTARLNVVTPPPPGTSVRCGKCKVVFPSVAPTELNAEPEEYATDDPAPQPPAVTEVGLAPKEGFAFDPDFPPTPRPTIRTKSSAAAGGKKDFPTLLIGGGLAVALAVGGLAYVLLSSGKPKPKPETANAGTTEPTPRPKSVTTPKKETAGGTVPRIPEELSALFRETTDRPAPTVLIPTLEKVGKEELAVPALAVKADLALDAGKLTLDEIKKATVYIKVSGPSPGTGSGFVIRVDPDAVFIATNHHVISDAEVFDTARVSVVFDSGTPAQREVRGEVIMADAGVDLAIIRVSAPHPAPKPIDPVLAVAPKETMEVRICGFPFGANITDGRNPTITIGKGTVSSLRLDSAGKLRKIQIDGSLNPGNSGGPIVDGDGRLVGVAVETIKGSGIGNAVPAGELTALLSGRVSAAAVMPDGVEGGQAKFRVAAPVSDPFRRITGVALHIRTGAEPPPSEKDEAGGWKPIPGAERIELTPEARTRTALGAFRLPAPAEGGKPPTVVLQLECRGSGGTVFSPPVAYKLAQTAVSTAADAIPMDQFRKDLSSHAGRVVAARGRLFSGAAVRRGAVFELQVTGDGPNEGRPDELIFVADREVATQLAELPTLQQALPARLTLRVGKPGSAAGRTPVRVTRIDLIGRNDRVVLSIPAKGEHDDKLTALNRAPEKFAGQTLTVEGWLDPAVFGPEKEPELSVALQWSAQRPINLCFVTAPAVAARVRDKAVLPEPARARLTVRVEDRLTRETVQQVVTVTRIELLGKDNSILKTIE